jgi:hypothetical protein
MAEETGESKEAVRNRIRRGKEKVGQHDQQKSQVAEKIEDTPEIIENRRSQGGGARPGAGRPRKQDDGLGSHAKAMSCDECAKRHQCELRKQNPILASSFLQFLAGGNAY